MRDFREILVILIFLTLTFLFPILTGMRAKRISKKIDILIQKHNEYLKYIKEKYTDKNKN